MPQLEIPNNVITLEKVVDFLQRRGREINDFYFNSLGVEIHEVPQLVEHEYYLQFGVDFADTRPWKFRIWHIPGYAQEEVYEQVQKLRDKHDVFPYQEQTLRRKWITHFVFVGLYEDDRGRALVHAEGEKGKIKKVTHSRRNW